MRISPSLLPRTRRQKFLVLLNVVLLGLPLGVLLGHQVRVLHGIEPRAKGAVEQETGTRYFFWPGPSRVTEVVSEKDAKNSEFSWSIKGWRDGLQMPFSLTYQKLEGLEEFDGFELSLDDPTELVVVFSDVTGNGPSVSVRFGESELGQTSEYTDLDADGIFDVWLDPRSGQRRILYEGLWMLDNSKALGKQPRTLEIDGKSVLVEFGADGWQVSR